VKFTRIGVLAGLILVSAYAQTTCISFPAGFIPFSSISYVTAADSAGDHLVVGVPASGALAFINANIPAPAFTNQTFCDAQVQLAPGQYYPNVYVPTAAEVSGNFSAFSGLLTIPGTSQPYAGGIIPPSQLTSVFAWRIGPAQAGSATQGWSATGPLPEVQSGQGAALLPNGKVLVVSAYDTSAYLYDPATGSFSPTGMMQFVHGSYLTPTLLNNGQVLIVGGTVQPSAAELYDPVSGTFAATGSPTQPHGYYLSATLLNDGRVLVVGGNATPGAMGGLNSGAETYDPQKGTFTAAGPMFANRNLQTATLLANGRVLIAGGYSLGADAGVIVPGDAQLDSAELYDPTTDSFSSSFPMTETRAAHVAVLLSNGKVLLAGGDDSGSAELYDPTTNSFTATGSMSGGPRSLACITLLSSGQPLVAGGKSPQQIATDSAELFDPSTGTFTPTGNLGTARANFTMTSLLDGRSLATGGFNGPLAYSSSELYTPTTQGLITSQTGLTYRVAQGNSGLLTQQVAVLSNTATIPFTVSTHTYEGGNWLVVSPSSGNSVPGAAPTTLTIAANPSGLAAQDYYGAVILTPTDGIHPPITIAIVLHIVPAGTAAPPVVTPGGLLFLGTPGATLAPQSFTISNLTSTPITFSGSGSTTPKWFNFAPSTGTIAGAQSASITVTPNITNLTAGAYPGSITLTFGDGSSQIVDLLLVLSPTAPTPNVRPLTTTPACTPSKLLPVFTTIGSGFNAPAAWPEPLVVDVVDDCGNAFNTGSVIVSFTDGDPPINLISTGNGNWGGTWVPQANTAGLAVRADAQALPLTGSVQVTGAVLSNPSVPVVSTGGVVSSADFASAPALGLLVSIFGSGLADAATPAPLPLPQSLGTTSVVLSGSATPLPLLYAANNIINVQIPYDAAVNSTQQLVVQHGNAISVPVPIAVFTASPSILSANGTGSGQGHVYVIGPGGVETQANASAPATAGNPLVIYCVGLGAVTPAVSAGSIVPYSPLSNANAPVTVTFGNQTVTAGFAGLTPGLAGLYQVNVNVPPGVMPGNQVPVTISVGGKSSSSTIYMAVQ
jgi:uncharacterized protein (TIGR03437 family)